MGSRRVVVTSRMSEVIADNVQMLDKAVLDMSTDIHRESQILAPKDTRALVKTGRIERLGEADYQVVYGGNYQGLSVPYARIHELGGWTGRGYSVYINPKGYLGTPGDRASRNIMKYIRKSR